MKKSDKKVLKSIAKALAEPIKMHLDYKGLSQAEKDVMEKEENYYSADYYLPQIINKNECFYVIVDGTEYKCVLSGINVKKYRIPKEKFGEMRDKVWGTINVDLIPLEWRPYANKNKV